MHILFYSRPLFKVIFEKFREPFRTFSPGSGRVTVAQHLRAGERRPLIAICETDD